MDKHFVLVSLAYLILLSSYEVHCKFEIYDPTECFPDGITYEEYQVDFYFSSKNQNRQNFTSLNSDNIDFDPKRRTVFHMHGLVPQIYEKGIEIFRDKFIKWGDINFIEVDWRDGCSNPFTYVKAVLNTEWAAISTKNLLMNAINQWKGTNKSIEHWGPLHFIGISLGAHVAGQAAELMKQNGVLIDRITGLDPAGPCFHDVNLSLRLRQSSARFVDVVHTDGGIEDVFQLGLLDPVGHVDFYVNGGRVQPGCFWFRSKRELLPFGLAREFTYDNGACKHALAYVIYIATLEQASTNGCKFWAVPWHSANLITGEPRPNGTDSCNKERCIEMGINTESYRNARGIYYVPTTNIWPFCKY